VLLKHNNTDSSSDFKAHIASMSNISTDQSNVERLNRWSCAWRMFLDRPITGFGPGTYMFKYAPYQRSWERTEVSTDAGNKGNAHSEYLGPLAEQGILGILLFVAVIIATTATAVRIINKSINKKTRILALSLYLALFTYYLHGFINDFLDMDKVTAIFWGFTAAIVALDVYHFEDSQETAISQVDRRED
jgi:O-antigen ligase